MKTTLLTLAFLFSLVLAIWWIRHRRLYEKYVAFWLLISLTIFVMAISPNLVGKLSKFFGFAVPSNFVFALATVTLLFTTFQLSQDISKLRKSVEELTIEAGLGRQTEE